MTILLYILAGFGFGYIIPEFIKMISPRDYRVPVMMNIVSGFAFASLVHYLLS